MDQADRTLLNLQTAGKNMFIPKHMPTYGMKIDFIVTL